MREDYFAIIDLRHQYGNISYTNKDIINALSEITLNQHLDETLQIIQGKGFNLENEFISNYIEQVKNDQKYYIYGYKNGLEKNMEYSISNVANSSKEIKDFYEWYFYNENFNLMDLNYYVCYTNETPNITDNYKKNDHIYISEELNVILCKGEFYLKNKKELKEESNLNSLIGNDHLVFKLNNFLSTIKDNIKSKDLKGNICQTYYIRKNSIMNITTSFPIYLAYVYRFGYIITTRKDNIVKFINTLRNKYNDNVSIKYEYNDRFLEIPEYTYHEIDLYNNKNELNLSFKNNEFNVSNCTYLNKQSSLTPEYDSGTNVVLLLYSGGLSSVLSYIILSNLSYNVQMNYYDNNTVQEDNTKIKSLTDTLKQLYKNNHSENEDFNSFKHDKNFEYVNPNKEITITDLELINRNSNFNFRDFINNVEYKYYNTMKIQKYINSLPLDYINYDVKMILGGFIKKDENIYSQVNNLNYLNAIERTFKFTEHQVIINDITQNLTRTEKWKLLIKIGDIDKLIEYMSFKHENQNFISLLEKNRKNTIPLDPKLLYNITSLRLLNRNDLIDRIFNNIQYENLYESDLILNSYEEYYQKLSYIYDEKSFTEIIDKLIISEDEKNILETKFL